MIDVYCKYLTDNELTDENKLVIESLLNAVYYLNYIDPFKLYDSQVTRLIERFGLPIPNQHILNAIELYQKINLDITKI